MKLFLQRANVRHHVFHLVRRHAFERWHFVLSICDDGAQIRVALFLHFIGSEIPRPHCVLALGIGAMARSTLTLERRFRCSRVRFSPVDQAVQRR
jgi:hypothetical protein